MGRPPLTLDPEALQRLGYRAADRLVEHAETIDPRTTFADVEATIDRLEPLA